jgi:hypothetical protein
LGYLDNPGPDSFFQLTDGHFCPSTSTHNVINYKVEKDLNCFVYLAPEFQVMIADGGTINYSGKCESIKLNMGEYFLDIPMISIQMGGTDVVLGVELLQSLGIVSLNFQYIFKSFFSDDKEIDLRGIQGNPSKVTRYNSMT